MMDDKKLKQDINFIVKSYGFKKKGTSWRKTCDDITVIIALQKSKYSQSFTFEIGICVDKYLEIDHLKYYSCGILFRLNELPDISEEQLANIDKALNLDEYDERIYSTFIILLNEKYMETVDKFFDISYLKQLYNEGFFKDKMIDNASMKVLSN